MSVVTLSRLYGVFGRRFGLELARSLGYDYLDKEILSRLSDKLNQDEERLAVYEETGYGPSESLVAMLTRKYPGASGDFPSPRDYSKTLADIIRNVSDRDRVVIVGRGSQAVLAGRPSAVHLRLVAGEDALIRGVAEKRRYRTCTEAELRKTVHRHNEARKKFVLQHFGIDMTDPLHYDLVINLDRVSRDEALELATILVRSRDSAAKG